MSSMISGSSSFRAFDSEDEIGSWLLSSECSSIDDEDELTLLNGDEDSDKDSITFRAYIELSARLKKKYNLKESSVSLERCDKIWDTMQLLKRAQSSFGGLDAEVEQQVFSEGSNSDLPKNEVPYIKYQPTQGTGNNGLPNFYLSVKSQKKVFNCPTCGKLYNEKRAMRIHVSKAHGLLIPVMRRRRKRSRNSESARSKPPNNLNKDFVEPEKNDAAIVINADSGPPYPCPICNHPFNCKWNMRKHARTKHNYDVFTGTHIKEEKNKGEHSRESEPKTIPKETGEIPVVREKGPKGSRALPRRACTAIATYAEPTKQDEMRARAQPVEPSSAKKISPGITTKCFLCSNHFVDIERHLKEYHRITRPTKAVLPLRDEVREKPAKEESKKVGKSKSEKKVIQQVNYSSTGVDSPSAEKKIESFCRSVFDVEKGREMFQCLICLYKYTDLSSVRRHLVKKIVNGVVQEHDSWEVERQRRIRLGYERNSQVTENLSADETDSGERASKVSKNTEEGRAFKRRRLGDRDDADEDEEEEEKASNQRDSSDRDSGIGISITIKKRNNSYEIVEKDNSPEDASKDVDARVADNSPSGIEDRSVPDEDASRSDPLSFSENNELEKNALTNNNDDNDDVTIINSSEVRGKNEGMSINCCRKDNAYNDSEARKNERDSINAT